MKEAEYKNVLMEVKGHYERGTLIIGNYNHDKKLKKEDRRGMFKLTDEKGNSITLIVTKLLSYEFKKIFCEEAKENGKLYRKIEPTQSSNQG